MDPMTGKLRYVVDDEHAKKLGLVPVRRDLTAKERSDMQIRLYSPVRMWQRPEIQVLLLQETAVSEALTSMRPNRRDRPRPSVVAVKSESQHASVVHAPRTGTTLRAARALPKNWKLYELLEADGTGWMVW